MGDVFDWLVSKKKKEISSNTSEICIEKHVIARILIITVFLLLGAGIIVAGYFLQKASFTDIPPGQWRAVGNATLADISNLGQVTLPLEEAVMVDNQRGIKMLTYRYRLVVSPGEYLYLTGNEKAHNGMGKYLLGNQPIPPGYGGMYVLNLGKEGIPSGFRLPGWRNMGYVAEVMVNGQVSGYNYVFQGRKQYLNPDKYEYRVKIDPNYHIPLLGDKKIRDGDILRPVPPAYPRLSVYPEDSGYGPASAQGEPVVVGYKVMLKSM